MENLQFKIEGEFICRLARSWFWEEGRDYAKCEELLLSCLETDEITIEEKKKIVVEILEGRKILVGVNSLSLVDDNENVRPLSQKIEQYKREETILKIKEDIERRPLAYFDRYSCDQNPDNYEGRTFYKLDRNDSYEVEEAFGKFLTPCEDLRLWAYSSLNVWYGRRRVLPGFWNEGERPFLDNGLYLIENPVLVYELIGGPVEDTEKLLLLFRNHLQSLVDDRRVNNKKAQEIIFRNKKFDAAQEIDKYRPEPPEDKDEINKNVKPDDFISEYGLIDPSGNYYSCTFAGHHVKAANIIRAKTGTYISPDKALDKLYSEGWALVRNPDPAGSVFFDYRGDRRPTKRQIDTAFSHMIKFDEFTLRGIEQYLDE